MVNCQFLGTEVLMAVFTFIEAVFIWSLFREQTEFVILRKETLGVYSAVADDAENHGLDVSVSGFGETVALSLHEVVDLFPDSVLVL